MRDDDLQTFAAEGASPLPAAADQGYVEHAGARIWYGSFGAGAPVIMLHGGLGSSDNWGYQVPALVAAGHRVLAIDSRGHGRSTHDGRPLSYDLMASDVLAVMDALRLDKAAIVGWSDGTIIGLTLAMRHPERVTRVFAFAGNMDLSGVKAIPENELRLGRMIRRLADDYVRLSATPDAFQALSSVVNQMMATQPNYSAADLAAIRVSVVVADGEDDEFLERAHMEYLAATIPGAALVILPGVSHFAPLQRPDVFNRAVLSFLTAPQA